MFPFPLQLEVTKRPLTGFGNILDMDCNDKLASIYPFWSNISHHRQNKDLKELPKDFK